ncbi:MAG TPA: hypothetical protein VME43_12295 [Bryobacteraceae bacterium]|nr:hypothetical protein [Bryobacteraceae bacterium]
MLTWVAALVMAAGQAQTNYNSYTIIGPLSTPLFGPAYSSTGRFDLIATDWAGNLYGEYDGPIWKIDPQGNLSPVTEFGPATVSPGQPVYALSAGPEYDQSLAGDSQGNLYLAGGTAIYRVSPDGLMTVYASVPAGAVACDSAGNVYAIAKAQIVRVASDGSSVVVAGTGVAGYSGDGGPALDAQIGGGFLSADAAGNIWLGDTANNAIRKIDPDGIITTVAQVSYLSSMAAFNGAVYYTNYSSTGGNPNQVMRVDANGVTETVAGVPYSAPYNGDGGPATAAWFTDILSLAVDPAGDLYIADSNRVREVDTAGIIHTVAGCQCGGNGGPAVWGEAGAPAGIAQDAAGNLYFSDQGSHMVRRIASDGTVSAVAGNGEAGFSGDGGPATAARLAWPAGLAFDSAGNLYIADEQNDRIREVTTDGIIRTVAGNGVAAFAGDGGPATAASLGLPDGVALDASGNLYIADTASHRIREVSTGGIIQTIAGSDQYGSSGDGGPAAQALLINPRSLVFDQAGNLVFTDSSARVVRRITPAGIIQRVAGTGQDGFSGNGGPAADAELDLPWGIAVDSSGDILIGDGDAVRSVNPAGMMEGVAYAPFSSIKGLAVDGAGDFWVAGGSVAVLSQAGPPFPLAPVITNQQITSAALSQVLVLTGQYSAAVAPGEFVTIPGARFGAGASAVQVLFDGISGTVLSVGPGSYPETGQITAMVPYEISGQTSVGITVEVNGVSSNTSPVAVLPAIPELYTHGFGTLLAATALNQDGTENGPGNPAPVGTVVSLFANGAGVMTPPETDGAIVSGPPFPVPALPVSVTMGTRPLAIFYAGAAPGLLAGALQVNVLIPNDLAPAPEAGVMDYYLTQLRVGYGQSLSAYIFVTP